MQMVPLSISLNYSSFSLGPRAKEIYKRGGKCQRSLARARGEMTPLVDHKDLFMVLV